MELIREGFEQCRQAQDSSAPPQRYHGWAAGWCWCCEKGAVAGVHLPRPAKPSAAAQQGWNRPCLFLKVQLKISSWLAARY